MTRKTRFSKFIVVAANAALFLALIVINWAHSNCYAEEGIMVVPPSFEYKVDPGQSINDTVEVSNISDQPVTYYPTTNDFSSDGQSGVPIFDFSAESTRSKHSLASWISFDQQQIALEPNQYQKIKFTINVPDNAEPGGHYAGILFSSQEPSISGKSSQVGQNSKVGPLIMLTVKGDIKQNMRIKEFSASSKYFQQPVNINLALQNSGNIHLKPIGEVNIYNLWGNLVSTIDLNESGGYILPGSNRSFNFVWSGHDYEIGRYRADLSISYGDAGQTLSSQIYFWIIPWWSVAVILLLVIIIIIWKSKRRRRYLFN